MVTAGRNEMESNGVINKKEPSGNGQAKRLVLKPLRGAGMKAPSWNHCRNRQFTVLCEREDKERAFAYAKAVAKRYADSSRTCPRPNLAQEMYACTMSRQYTRLIDCPYVIVPLYKCAGLNAEWTRRRNLLSTAWCVAENIMLAVTNEGVAALCVFRRTESMRWC